MEAPRPAPPNWWVRNRTSVVANIGTAFTLIILFAIGMARS